MYYKVDVQVSIACIPVSIICVTWNAVSDDERRDLSCFKTVPSSFTRSLCAWAAFSAKQWIFNNNKFM